MNENQKLREALPYGLVERLERSIAWLERGELLPGASACIGLDDIKAMHKMLSALALPETAAPVVKESLTVAATVDEQGLPPLPKPHIGLPWRHNAPDGSVHCSAFTADQMRAYALSALSSAGDAKDAERWQTSELISKAALTHPDKRTEDENKVFNAYRKEMESGNSYAACVDAAIRARSDTAIAKRGA